MTDKQSMPLAVGEQCQGEYWTSALWRCRCGATDPSECKTESATDATMTPPAAPFGELDALYEKATKGPWTHHKPGCCRAIMYKDGVICQLMNNRVDMQDATGHAPTPEQAQVNMQLIVALVNAYPALKAAHAAAATAARNDALEEAARVLDTTFPDDWSEWAAAKIRALAAQGKG